jgi:PAS domain S-box-containing protein
MEPEQILRSAIEACPFGIVIVEPLGKIVLANSEMERMFGYVHDEFIGQAVDIFVPTNVRAQYIQQYNQFVASPQTGMVEKYTLSGRHRVPCRGGLQSN